MLISHFFPFAFYKFSSVVQIKKRKKKNPFIDGTTGFLRIFVFKKY